jgi:hypothetical protein
MLSAKLFSSVSKEPTGGISGWMERRKLSKEKERYQEQMERLANMEQLTLESYKKELERGLTGWGASLSSLLQSKEVKMAKEVVSAVDGIIEVMGKDANVDELLEMTRLERLKVAAACNKTVEEVGILLLQIQNMDVMQRILRRRKLEGKPIPEDPTHLHNVIKNDALNVMTKTQKTLMKKRHQTIARSMARRKR